jgi:hypothetical protein
MKESEWNNEEGSIFFILNTVEISIDGNKFAINIRRREREKERKARPLLASLTHFLLSLSLSSPCLFY